ncbi:MAG: ABC transporter substrate-binding protein [Phycisphaerales bacterium]|nr:ABC transporter substrate-binding protein [Planctomycetota bacterium]MCH8507907.1 ABC transporter substrate-binding protein [Phycisphaerales bacterium]
MPGTTTLTLAHSPDADDLVMWWPLTGQNHPDAGRFSSPQLDAGGLAFALTARDVEELNKLALTGESVYDITAISAAAYPAIADRYAITRAGASFGEHYGPKLVVRKDSAIETFEDLAGDLVAIPGVNTTAYMTLRLARPGVRVNEMLFSEIPEAVASGEADAGLLIHEAQLTLDHHNLRAIADMGQWWGTQTGLPLPLGLNVIRRDLPDLDAICDLLARSVAIAAEEREASKAFLRRNNAGKPEWDDDALLDWYLDMYVSPMTVDMGETGRRALGELYRRAHDAGLIDAVPELDIR